MEFLTISAFAEKAGVTVQAVYKRLPKDLAPYTKEENGVKLINQEALTLYSSSQQTKREIDLKKQLALLEDENEELKRQLTALNQEKMELLQSNNNFSAKLLEILETQTKQQENFQVLLAQQQRFQTSLIETSTTVEEGVNQLKEVVLNDKKPSLINRLFGRK